MPPLLASRAAVSGPVDTPLSDREIAALRAACGPVGILTFPPIDVIRTLRQQGYVTIVLGGVAITPIGLERLLKEQRRRQVTQQTA